MMLSNQQLGEINWTGLISGVTQSVTALGVAEINASAAKSVARAQRDVEIARQQLEQKQLELQSIQTVNIGGYNVNWKMIAGALIVLFLLRK